MTDDEGLDRAKNNIIRLIQESSEPLQPKRKVPRRTQGNRERLGIQIGDFNRGNVFYIDGSGNTFNMAPEKIVKKVTVKTGDGTLTAEQKRKILDKVSELVGATDAVRKQSPGYGKIWLGLNRHMKVNSYHEIRDTDFDKAMAWLLKQKAVVNGMRSAPKKNPAWRVARYRGTNARCKEFIDGESRMRAYMAKVFGKASQRELTDDELDVLYRHVMGWKRP